MTISPLEKKYNELSNLIERIGFSLKSGGSLTLENSVGLDLPAANLITLLLDKETDLREDGARFWGYKFGWRYVIQNYYPLSVSHSITTYLYYFPVGYMVQVEKSGDNEGYSYVVRVIKEQPEEWETISYFKDVTEEKIKIILDEVAALGIEQKLTRTEDFIVYKVIEADGTAEWVCEYPDLKGCIGVGDSYGEAILSAEENKIVWMEARNELFSKQRT